MSKANISSQVHAEESLLRIEIHGTATRDLALRRCGVDAYPRAKYPGTSRWQAPDHEHQLRTKQQVAAECSSSPRLAASASIRKGEDPESTTRALSKTVVWKNEGRIRSGELTKSVRVEKFDDLIADYALNASQKSSNKPPTLQAYHSLG
ncbi:hypothetical protein CVT26_008711, partial [Gymnopilus dilepis]